MSYVYSPLDSSKVQIRLLKVKFDVRLASKSANASKPLRCSIETHSLPAPHLSRGRKIVGSVRLPLFDALSYVWGDPTFSHYVLVDDKKLPITANLYRALRNIQAMAYGDVRIWADGVCINQADQVEKASQIILMREIYHQASYVRIWLGPDEADSRRCLSFVGTLTNGYAAETEKTERAELSKFEEGVLRGYYSSAGALVNAVMITGQTSLQIGDIIGSSTQDEKVQLLDADDKLSLNTDLIEKLSKWRPKPRYLERVAHENLEEMAVLIDKIIIQKSWFERMWVVQELCSNNYGDFVVGEMSITWELLVKAVYWLHYTCGHHIPNIRKVVGLEKIRIGFDGLTRPPLRDLIRECRQKFATDPRDKIYSLLGLMGEPINEYLRPNYEGSLTNVYTKATLHFLNQSQSLDAICTWQTTGRHVELPYWVPDYSLSQNATSEPLAPTDGRPSIFAASGYDHRSKYCPPDLKQAASDGKLRTNGLIVDTIEALSICSPTDTLFENIVGRWRSALFEGMEAARSGAIASSLDDMQLIIRKYGELLRSPSKEPMNPPQLDFGIVDQEYILDAFIQSIFSGRISSQRRLTKDLIHSILRMEPPLLKQSASAAMTSQESFFQHHNISFSSHVGGGTPMSPPEKPEPPSEERFKTALESAILAGTTYRRLIVTQNGCIGTVPEHARLGDLVCVLFGCTVPLVLREASDGSGYQLIGESYLHGFMDAEAIAMQVQGALVAEEIMLI